SVLILGEAAELPNEIDIKRAEEAKARAEKRLQQAKAGKKDVDVVRAEAALKRALLRLRLVQKAQSR
ncbi:MAG: F0F1 ATP synthase subunit epsilon, partial [Planctomycetota bacterium]